MMPESRFSSELDDVRELPPPLGKVVSQHIRQHEIISLLIYKPAEQAGDSNSPPKALAITDRGLIFAQDIEGQSPQVVRADFDSLLLVELATLLLYGHLRIDFVEGGNRHNLAMEYNTVSHDLYRRAAALLLEGAAPKRSEPAIQNTALASPGMTDWPKPIRRAVESAILPDSTTFTAAWWPSHRRGFGHGLAPAGAILARQDRLTVVILEDSGPWNRVLGEPSYGSVVTFLPSDRIAQVSSQRAAPLTILELEMHASHGGERFQLAIPSDREAAVRTVIDGAISLRA